MSDPIIITELDANGTYALPRGSLWLVEVCTEPGIPHGSVMAHLELIGGDE